MASIKHPRLMEWWVDDPSDPGRLELDDPDVQKLIAQISSEARASDLGGNMSLNVKIEPSDLVLRVHQPFVSRGRLLAVQAVRDACTKQGLIVPAPMLWNNAPLIRCRNRWAELERYIPHERPKHTFDSYIWLFRAMGILHRTLVGLDLKVPRPLVVNGQFVFVKCGQLKPSID